MRIVLNICLKFDTFVIRIRIAAVFQKIISSRHGRSQVIYEKGNFLLKQKGLRLSRITLLYLNCHNQTVITGSNKKNTKLK